MEFKNIDKPYITNKLCQDVIRGYVSPHETLVDQEFAEEVYEAIHLVRKFIDEAVSKGILEEYIP